MVIFEKHNSDITNESLINGGYKMGRNKIHVDINKLIDLIDKGYTQIQIAKELRIGKNTIVRILEENNLSTKTRYEDLVGKVYGK